MVHFPEILTTDGRLASGFVNAAIIGGKLILQDTGESFQIGNTVVELTPYFDAFGTDGTIGLLARPNLSSGPDVPITNGNYFLRFSLDGVRTDSNNSAIPVAPMTFYLEDRSFMSQDGVAASHDSNPNNLLIAAITISSGATVVSKTRLTNLDKLNSGDLVSNSGGTLVGSFTYQSKSDTETLNWGRRPTSWSILENTVGAGSGILNGGANYASIAWLKFDRYKVQLQSGSDWTAAVVSVKGRFNFRVMA